MKQQLLFFVVNIVVYVLLIWVVAPFITDQNTYRGDMSILSRDLTWLAWSAGLCVLALVISCIVGHHLFHRIWHGFASLALLLLALWVYDAADSYYYYNKREIRTAWHRKKDWCEWDIALSAARNHPIAVWEGRFTYTKGRETGSRHFRKYRTAFTRGWGERLWLSESEYMEHDYTVYPLPQDLQIKWFSLSEQKLYTAEAELPQERLRELFLDKGYSVDGKMKKCDGFRVGLAPGGRVTVWAECKWYTIELMHFQAEESDVTVADIPDYETEDEIPSKADYTASFLDDPKYSDLLYYLSTHTIDSEIERIDRYMDRYNTRLIVGFEDQQNNTISSVDINCVNGEHLQVYNREPVSTDHAALGRVNYIHVEWVNREDAYFEEKRDLEVRIGNNELSRIAGEAWGDNPDKPVDIVMNISNDNNNYDIEIYATDGTRRIDFDREAVKFRCRGKE